MKLNELLTEEELYELNWRKAVATGALAASAVAAPTLINKFLPHDKPQPAAEQPAAQKPTAAQQKAMDELEHRKGVDQLTQVVLAKYKHISPELAREVVTLANKYAKPNFPKAKDILAIVGIESSFDPNAVSGLKRDPARGLMQVRPVTWGLKPSDLNGIENQIKIGSGILHQYFNRTGDIDSAVHAYNIGMRNFLNQKGLNPGYVTKFNKERQLYNTPAVAKPPKT